MQLLLELAAATAMVAATVTTHLAGLAALLALLRRHRQGRPDRRGLIAEGLAIVAAAAGLFVLHGIEIWAYAALYLGVGAVGNLETALYFSTASYTTVGYGDVVLDPRWRVVGAIESANGIILLGWSTAFFVSIVGRIRWLEAEAQELS
ncbi:potassium channel family protein [Sphingomonas sp. IW22]|uniref:potassium channel family protein n=1 Tax=Sphingomonas sp. IW22 TaxID=3242489 RepID=UPI00351FD1CC